ncbi:hypothetical protein GLW36_12660 [Halorubrum terrestre]|uniref:DUF1102 domain-containing protein n=1 Tax=Halorubrum distributum TaxID=29283 RepID=A0A6B1IP60_9EURY|nr:hypothetical protein [Halorubrum terrestre]
MKPTRRTVLGVVGTLGVGAGAAFGSGAFTSTTAERAVEVNVFGADGVVRNGDNEDNVAGAIRDNIIDVLVDTEPNSVSIDSPNLNDGEDGADLFPTNPRQLVGYDGVVDKNFVSLVANDVTIVFGEEGGLPPNSTIDYAELFAFVSNRDNELAFDIIFEPGAESGGELLTRVDGQTVSDGATVRTISGPEVPVRADAEVTTGTTSPETEQVNIRIEPQDD